MIVERSTSRRSSLRRRLARSLVCAALVAGTAGCGLRVHPSTTAVRSALRGSPTVPPAAPPILQPAVHPAQVAAAGPDWLADPPVPVSTATARLLTDAVALDAPGGRARAALPAHDFGAPTVVPVVGSAPGWLQVMLPDRPNHSTGWIPRSAVSMGETPDFLVINVRQHRLRWYEAGRLQLDAPAAVGNAATPTPLGSFYVRLLAPTPGPGYGSFALVTSAHSEAIGDWGGSGDAIVAIHGPVGADTAIGSSGAAISHGCVRLHLADLARLAAVHPGTPVSVMG